MYGVIKSKFKNQFSSSKSPAAVPSGTGNHLVIDIGATKTLIALFSRRGRAVSRCKFPTAHGSKTFLDMLEKNLRPYKQQEIQSVVLAVPGVVQKNYTVRFGNRSWGDFDILTPIKKLFKCPIYVINDADVAAFFEARGLPGRSVYLTFSTGIGGSVMRDDNLLRINFEPGHKTYTYLGRTAEWEDIASASAIDNFYHIDRLGSLHGQSAFRDVAARVSLGLPDIVKRFNPTTIIIGGPMAYIFNRIAPYLPEFEGVTYKPAAHPEESVIQGGYLYALRESGALLPTPAKATGDKKAAKPSDSKDTKKAPKTNASKKAVRAHSTPNKSVKTPSSPNKSTKTHENPTGKTNSSPDITTPVTKLFSSLKLQLASASTKASLIVKKSLGYTSTTTSKSTTSTSKSNSTSTSKSTARNASKSNSTKTAKKVKASRPQKKPEQPSIQPSIFRKKSSRTPVQVSLPKKSASGPAAKDTPKSKAAKSTNSDRQLNSLSDLGETLGTLSEQATSTLKTFGHQTSKTFHSLFGRTSKK